MAVKNTKKWLKNHIHDPLELCNQLLEYFPNMTNKQLFHYLQQFGMYRYSRKIESDLEQLIEDDVWTQVEALLARYQKKWKGPDVPIFIFPYRTPGLFTKGYSKSGLAYKDKLLFFLSPKLTEKHIEALFIHEYHHVCRLNRQSKNLKDYTLVESIILEGLAEYTVQQILGSRYLAPWTKRYSESYLTQMLKGDFNEHIHLVRTEKKHDWLLYGKGKYPYMLGYCLGFYLVEQYMKNHVFEIGSSFEISADTIFGEGNTNNK